MYMLNRGILIALPLSTLAPGYSGCKHGSRFETLCGFFGQARGSSSSAGRNLSSANRRNHRETRFGSRYKLNECEDTGRHMGKECAGSI